MLSFFLTSLLLNNKHQTLRFISSFSKVAFWGWLDFFSLFIQVCHTSGSQKRIISISGLAVTQNNKRFAQWLESILLLGGVDGLKDLVVGFENLLLSGTWFNTQDFVVIDLVDGGGSEGLTQVERLAGEW